MSLAIVEHCEGVLLAQDVRFWRAAARVALEPKERRYRLRQARNAALRLRALAKRIEERGGRSRTNPLVLKISVEHDALICGTLPP